MGLENDTVLFDFDFSFEDKEPEIEVIDISPKSDKRRTTECLIRSDRYLYRRAYSETQLMDAIDQPLQKGHSYHCLTQGDVDGMSYLKIILRQQKKLDYLLFSTWCMAGEDVVQIERWLKDGVLKKIDAYVGEIFPKTYKMEYAKLKQVFEEHKCGRIVVFRNHAKIFAGYGKEFAFGIQMSANINTNPRTENACITIGQEIFEFYKSFFDNMKSNGKT